MLSLNLIHVHQLGCTFSLFHFLVSLPLYSLLPPHSPPSPSFRSLFHTLSLPLFLLPPSTQGLYEYAKPVWQERPRPQVDEGKVKNFGQNVAPRPLNPAEKQLQLYPVAMEINGVEAPRYTMYSFSLVSCTTCTFFHLPFPFLPPFPLSLLSSTLHLCPSLSPPQHRPHSQDVYWWCSEASRCSLCQTRHEPLWEDRGPGI